MGERLLRPRILISHKLKSAGLDLLYQAGFELDERDGLKGKIVRLGHMGYIDYFEVLGAIAALELVLFEMGWPVEVGAGVAAAQQATAHGMAVRQPVVV